MESALTLLTVLLLGLSPGLGYASDLTRIERRIVKEPSYQQAPKYCLLVFGKEAKTRIWLVHDSDTLYVDRNGNGDLTERGEQVKQGPDRTVFQAGDITEADGKTKHTNLEVTFDPKEGWKIQVRVNGNRPQRTSWSWEEPLLIAEDIKDAPIVHFNGPLTLRLVDYDLLRRSGIFCVEVGTAGLGKGTFSAIETGKTFSSGGDIPKGVHPFAEIECPSKDEGGPPIRIKLALRRTET